MNKLAWIIVILFIIVAVVSFFSARGLTGNIISEEKCTYSTMNVYCSDRVLECRRIVGDGTLDAIRSFGVEVNYITVTDPSDRSNLPKFEIGREIYYGYKNRDELKRLLRCN